VGVEENNESGEVGESWEEEFGKGKDVVTVVDISETLASVDIDVDGDASLDDASTDDGSESVAGSIGSIARRKLEDLQRELEDLETSYVEEYGRTSVENSDACALVVDGGGGKEEGEDDEGEGEGEGEDDEEEGERGWNKENTGEDTNSSVDSEYFFEKIKDESAPNDGTDLEDSEICMVGTIGRNGTGSLGDVYVPPSPKIESDAHNDKKEGTSLREEDGGGDNDDDDDDDELMELEEVGDGVYKCMRTGRFFALK